MPLLAFGNLWKPIALAAFVSAALIYRVVLVSELKAARAEAGRLKAEAAGLRASNAAFQSQVEKQNEAVAALAGRARAAEAAMQTREDRAAALGAAIAERGNQAASALMAAPIASGCEGAIAWGNKKAEELARW